MKKWMMIIGLMSLLGTALNGQYSPWWFDGYDVSANSFGINFETGFPRQGGSITPTNYLTSTLDPSNDYHHQLFTGGDTPLQLAGDAAILNMLVSPDYNFIGTDGSEIIGKRMAVVMDAYTNNPGGTYFTNAAITVAANSALTQSGTGGLSISFVEQTFNAGAPTTLVQVYDGSTLIVNNFVNPNGFGGGFVEILMEDPVDGNPWDGIGTSVASIYINGTPVIENYVKGGGGFTNNFITLEGTWEPVSGGLATHTFNNLEVNKGVVPEPSAYACFLGILALGAVMRQRVRRQRAG